jgi:hypothetical protein
MPPIERDPGDRVSAAMYDVLSTLGGAAAHAATEHSGVSEERRHPAVELMLTQGYAAPGRTLPDCLATADERINIIRYGVRNSRSGESQEMTEGDALREFNEYLQLALVEFRAYAEGHPADRDVFDSYIRALTDMHDRLFVVGEKEFKEGAAGISELWRYYLNEDPSLDLAVPHEVVGSTTYFKSSQLVFAEVMSNFAPDDPLRERIISGHMTKSRPGRCHKHIILDDWSKAGLQVSTVVDYLDLTPEDDAEVHLIAASDLQLERGIKHRYYDTRREPFHVPVRAHFHAGKDTSLRTPGLPVSGPLITGSHSTVDFDFFKILELVTRMVKEPNDARIQQLPALAKIARQPRPSPAVDEFTEW